MTRAVPASAARRRVLTLLLSVALAVAAVPAVSALRAEATTFSFSIQPAIEGNRAVRGGQEIVVSGSAPPGTITSARLLGLERAGGFAVQTVVGPLNQPPTSNYYLRNDNGQLSGRLLLGCVFDHPWERSCPIPREWVESVALEVTIGDQTRRSDADEDPLRVDFVRPYTRGYFLVDVNRIRVQFSEPVRDPQDLDTPERWTISNPTRRVLRVEGAVENDCAGWYDPDSPEDDPRAGSTGCSRTLVLDQPVHEDATPFVSYGFSPLRNTYVDYARNFLAGTVSRNPKVHSHAIDWVLPALPRIERIGERTTLTGDERVVSNDTDPTASVANVIKGHDVYFAATPPAGGPPAFGDPTLAEEDGSVEVQVPTLDAGDGEYTLEAIVRDLSGNRSSEASEDQPEGKRKNKSSLRLDGSPSVVTYVLDTKPPRIRSALRTGARDLRVTFTEPVFPDGDAGQWQVNGQPASASGEGEQRTVTASQDISGDDVTVSWTPNGGAYRDEAGNDLEPVSGFPAVPLPPLRAPVVEAPAGELYTDATQATISGTVEMSEFVPSVTVALYDAGAPAPRETKTVAPDGTWSFTVPLALETRWRFEVQARDDTDRRTDRTAVPAIIHDSIAPLHKVLQPGPSVTTASVTDADEQDLPTADARPRFAIGRPAQVQWLARDPAPLDQENTDHGDEVTIGVEFDDGGSRDLATRPYAADSEQTYSHTFTSQDLGGQSQREGRFVVTVADLAGNDTTDWSFPFVIDGTLLGYKPIFVQNDPSQSVVEAWFPTQVLGTTRATEWRIDGLPVRTAAQQTRGGQTVVVLVASQSITDPNAEFDVQFTPTPLAPDRLRGPDGQTIDTGAIPALDGIPPVLSLDSAPAPGPRHVQTVQISGTTDETSHPNNVRAVRVDAAGNPVGGPVSQTRAGSNGRFTLTVPMEPDRLNRIGIQALDPAGNVSPTRAFEVIEDSTPPVVRVTHPRVNDNIASTVGIRWTTIDANPDVVDVDYRVNGGSWQSIAAGAPDDGAQDWAVPDEVEDDDVLDLRVAATDQAGHAGQAAIVPGLMLGLPDDAPDAPFPGESVCDDPAPAPFADRDRIPEVHRVNVDCLHEIGIAKGTQRDGQLWFLPHDDISRAQFSGFAYRSLEFLGEELPGPAERFEDVPAGHTFDTEIHRLAAAEIVEGYDRRRFGPADPIKRDQTASLLLRAWEHSRGETLRAQGGGYFADTGASFHRVNIDAAYEAGLVQGRVAPGPSGPGVYEPAAHTSRAQMATVLVRYLDQHAG